ncbi:hypothetical protein J6590_011584 [Homalodisca vitripennis]|nr:hypothetical protein J6590_011584 [Homalodisca vitripennis]
MLKIELNTSWTLSTRVNDKTQYAESVSEWRLWRFSSAVMEWARCSARVAAGSPVENTTYSCHVVSPLDVIDHKPAARVSPPLTTINHVRYIGGISSGIIPLRRVASPLSWHKAAALKLKLPRNISK